MMMMINIYKWLQELKPVLFMIVVQFCFAGINVFYKLAAYDGMSLKVLVAYRFFFAIVFLVPLALIFERKSRPRLTWTILFQAFLCGFFGGSLTQNLYAESLVLTSATFASAMTNLIPAVTFVLAISFGLEKMGVKTRAGKAKVMGTLLGLGGAMLLTFYKGAEIKMWSTHINLMKIVKPHGGHVASSSGTQILGSLFAIANCFSFSLWLIIQAKMSANYPCPYSSTALMSVMAAIQETTFTLCTERDWTQWKLGWNIRLWSAAYAGIIVHGMMITLVIWCVRLKGPLYTSAFYPLMLVFTALMGPLLLDEYLHVGSILGATLIVCGLYAVLWGKDKEMKKMAQKISKEAETIQTINTSTSDNSENQNRGIIMDKTEEMERKV
ncbi:WAT1-related protein At1g25270 [Ricinus communis]|uniref:WAT1-related protein n=1 Tax=Ricinus communis TaxID=3988 RepID=B9T8R0_RICCO|nr:WAT1-related protein At1g25270 [Ricinus communis]EEF27752.1 Auxin-induced protein 5NG4, putative [Ricinus communis]|eukprot:XP_002534629.3 WAT1-related protein At1g25270 isoform X1 [Ricinus communis]